MKKAVFLDKDGTLVRDVAYNQDPARVELLPGVRSGLLRLQGAGYTLLVVTNQSGVALGHVPEERLPSLFTRIEALLDTDKPLISGFYYCPHHPAGQVSGYAVTCACRKPLPGLLLKAAREHSLDLSRSWMIGDILHDVEAGRRAGCRTILLHTGYETEWKMGVYRWPDYVVSDLEQAADRILAVNDECPALLHPASDLAQGRSYVW